MVKAVLMLVGRLLSCGIGFKSARFLRGHGDALSFWDEWFKRFGRRSSIYGDIERMMEEMEREMAEAFKGMEGNLPSDTYREVRQPDGSTRREYGPFVYGYSVKIGPDGKPVIREFGNMKPGLAGEGESPLSLTDRREPLVDVIEDADTVKVLAELPGVDKQDIKVIVTPSGLTLDVGNATRKYYKELEFPAEVEEEAAESSYRNGVLEIVFRKKRKETRGTQLRIE
jgi:HSP20 family protein